MVERVINKKLTSSGEFEELYPFKPNFINVSGHKLHYVDQGQGPAILMVHGNPTWSFYFRGLINSLSREYRTIVPDHIGCGFSDKPAADEYEYTLASRVRDLDTLITRTVPEGKLSLIVHDWGGMIGLAWALDHMDRIDKLIITNTSGFLLPPGKDFPLRLWLIKYLYWFAVPAVLGFNLFAKAAVFMAAEKKLPIKVKKGLLEPYNSWKNRIATLKFVQDIPISEKDQSYTIVNQVDQRLKTIDPKKLLFLWGAKDFVFDLKFFEEFKRRFPEARSEIFHDAGHYLFEDKTEETQHLIKEFLADKL